VHEVLNSPGRPLDKATRDFFEPRFGHDFSRVRVHVGGQASASAKAVQAQAYSVGNAVVFGEEQYRPESLEGRRLIAHELAHTVQQAWVTVPRDRELEVSRPDDRLEVEAHRMARQVSANESVVAPPATLGPTKRPHLFRQGPPAAGGPPGGSPKRVVFLDSDVLSQITGGNKPAAEKLLQLRSGGAEIRIARPTFNETQRGLPQQVAARRLVVEQLGIKIDEGSGLGSRGPTYDIYAQKGVKVQTKDLPMIAAAKASGGEIWSFDGGVKSNVAQFGVKLSPESSLPSLNSPLDVRAGLDNCSLHEFSVATDGTITRKPSGGGAPGGGQPGGGGPPETPPPGGKPAGGAQAAGGKAPAAPGMALAPLASGATPRPASQADIVARQRLIAQLEAETAESARFAGRLRAYGAVLGGLMQVYSAFTAVTDALTLQSEGTLFGDAQRKAEAISARSGEDFANVQTVTDSISLFNAVASVSKARELGDGDALFGLSASLGDCGMALSEPADRAAQMSKDLSLRVQGLEVLEKFYERMMNLPSDPLAGTIPQSQAFAMYESIGMLSGPLRTASRNYSSAASLLSLYANYLGALAHEANQSAWTLALRKASQASPQPRPAERPAAQEHATPAGVHLETTPHGSPSEEEQKGKVPCPTCHDGPKDESKGQWHSIIPDEFKPKMTEQQAKQWIQSQGR
jgi:hypothetical protein